MCVCVRVCVCVCVCVTVCVCCVCVCVCVCVGVCVCVIVTVCACLLCVCVPYFKLSTLHKYKALLVSSLSATRCPSGTCPLRENCHTLPLCSIQALIWPGAYFQFHLLTPWW